MTTCRDVITLAMKLAKAIASGENPSADEAQDGLVCLQSLYDHWATSGLFGQLQDSVAESSVTADKVVLNSRYRLFNGATVTLPTEQLQCGTEYPPYDLSIVETSNGTTLSRKVYEAGIGGWVELTGLTLDSIAPLSTRGAVGLASALATSSAFIAMFGDAALSPRVDRAAQAFQLSLSLKLGGDRPKLAAEYF